MDIKVTLRLLLSNKKNTFTLDEPCVCCGKPSINIWTYNNKYNLERWVASSGGKTGNVEPIKQGYNDKSGNTAQGEVEINLPYCSEHLKQSERLRKYHSNQTYTMIFAGVIAAVLYLVIFGWNWIGDSKTNIEMGFRACGMPIIVFLSILGISALANTVLNESKSAQPKYIDYPINSSAGGGSGLAITVNGENTGMIGQFVRYYLILDFKNIDAAKQFKQKYSGAVILKGKELLEQ